MFAVFRINSGLRLAGDADGFGSRGRKAFLVLLAGIRPLLDLDHLGRLQHGKAVSAVGQQNHIAGQQETAAQLFTTSFEITACPFF